ncbi:MAG: hypothetical protein NTW86_19675, partial [Candidatus Sumerlaeota bacterium]|nr:hypothetical protein [Candidatus Sumerlaeota bacterium]
SRAMPNAEDLYASAIRALPPYERLRLASLILDDLAAAGLTADWDDTWNEEDVHDLAAHVARRAEQRYPREDDLA